MANRDTRNRKRVLKMSEHPYFSGYAAGATGGHYATAWSAWSYRVGHRSAAQYGRQFTDGYADGRDVALKLDKEATS